MTKLNADQSPRREITVPTPAIWVNHTVPLRREAGLSWLASNKMLYRFLTHKRF